jgi:hypothetical protein
MRCIRLLIAIMEPYPRRVQQATRSAVSQSDPLGCDPSHQKAGQILRFVYDRGNKILEKSTTGVTKFHDLGPSYAQRCPGVGRSEDRRRDRGPARQIMNWNQAGGYSAPKILRKKAPRLWKKPDFFAVAGLLAEAAGSGVVDCGVGSVAAEGWSSAGGWAW